MRAEYRFRIRPRRRRGSSRAAQEAFAEECTLCERIESYLQETFDNLPVNEPLVVCYNRIARKFGADIAVVRKVMYPLQGGYNGVTLCKQD